MLKNSFVRNLVLVIADIVIMVFSSIFALMARYDFMFSAIPEVYLEILKLCLPYHILISIVVFYLAKLYKAELHSIGLSTVISIAVSVFIANALTYLVSLFTGLRLPVSVVFFRLIIEVPLFVFEMCFFRIKNIIIKFMGRNSSKSEKALIVGAGNACDMLLRENEVSSEMNYDFKTIIDDNPDKIGKSIRNVLIEGNRYDIPRLVKKYGIEKIIFAIPSAGNKERKEILDICDKCEVTVRIVPGIAKSLDGDIGNIIREVSIEDLLGREQVILDDTLVNQFIKDKVIMVTGGGGSIGSELCRQIAKRNPKKLIILDIYENNAYDIQQELKREYGNDLNLTVEIASVRDKDKIYELFNEHKPEVVFHAAAHKHVPLMEDCPSEAIKNNIFGTYHVVKAAEKFGTKKFVLISTDKAVNPTNVMGATKRFCEMIIQSRKGMNTSTEYAVVRFGNVLGSNGSVVPLFKKQIAEGGHVTITDKRIIRYFMTIPEAAQLVMQAGAMAKQNQVFVLDMGEPVKILDLAEKLIRLSGKKPYMDIDIIETGLRPGEKLYEELLMKSENLIKTAHSDIYIEEQKPLDVDKIYDGLKVLDELVTKDIDNITPDEVLKDKLKELVPTYMDPNIVNTRAERLMEEEGRDTLGDIAKESLLSLAN